MFNNRLPCDLSFAYEGNRVETLSSEVYYKFSLKSATAVPVRLALFFEDHVIDFAYRSWLVFADLTSN